MMLSMGTILSWTGRVISSWAGKRIQVIELDTNPKVKLLDPLTSAFGTFEPGYTFRLRLDVHRLGRDIEIVSKKPNRKLGDI